MQRSRKVNKKQKKPQSRGCKAFCCTCSRLSVSSSDEVESSNSSYRFHSVSSIAHAMVQERLDQMIREREEARNEERIRRARREETKFVVMMAMEKSSYDPRQDFRQSMEQMIIANRIQGAKDLRQLLNYYVTMNSDEFRGVILEYYLSYATYKHSNRG
ncbi:hypothetical protein BUALT_Bualt03G0081200 [Buddleja alternifolia]|uniref:Transcription repressor n=1 Tax=Buddleja alternifolia TaxID=168488 RepID=A0AAV6XU67_9LAMI|nr:hypothetical protein BUALT_Bualt03G0081200 [Buddleja alternifolia]